MPSCNINWLKQRWHHLTQNQGATSPPPRWPVLSELTESAMKCQPQIGNTRCDSTALTLRVNANLRCVMTCRGNMTCCKVLKCNHVLQLLPETKIRFSAKRGATSENKYESGQAITMVRICGATSMITMRTMFRIMRIVRQIEQPG